MASDTQSANSGETLVVDTADDGLRLDLLLARHFPARSRAQIQQCVKSGLIRRNGQPCRPADKVRANDHLQIAWPPPRTTGVVAENIPLDILYEDRELLVVNKQPGLVVHPNSSFHSGTLVNALVHHDPDSFQPLVDQYQRPGIVHRLDKDTSGALVIAKNLRAWRHLKAAFKERDVEKTYLAIVIGEFGSVAGRLENQIDRHPVHRTRMAVVDEGGKLAITNYRVLGGNGELTLMQVRIETGRTHQIRVHFAHLNHPILGDEVYGGRQRDLTVEAPRQMLHAWKLVFPHPTTGIKREYMAPPPADFRAVLAAAGLPMIAGDDQPPPPLPRPNLDDDLLDDLDDFA